MSTESRDADREIADTLRKEDEVHDARREKAVRDALASMYYDLQVTLGPMLGPMFPWERLKPFWRGLLNGVYDAGVNTESGMRTQDAMQASWNVLHAVLAGQAIGSKDPEQIAQTKELLGVSSKD